MGTAFYIVAAILALSLGLASAANNTCNNASDSYGYSGPNGPEKWGSLSPEYKACGSGKSQSPIDINRNDTVENNKLGKLAGGYRPVGATLVNAGHNIRVHFNESPGALEIEGKTYPLKQMHWHTPSEHTIDGHEYPLELHIVHRADDGRFTTVVLLYEYGPENKFLAEIKCELEELAKKNKSQVALKTTTEYDMLEKSWDAYYRYNGSLTHPPCTENVWWTVLARPETVSKEQVEALQKPLAEGFKMNSRPVQPLNGRKVELFQGME